MQTTKYIPFVYDLAFILCCCIAGIGILMMYMTGNPKVYIIHINLLPLL